MGQYKNKNLTPEEIQARIDEHLDRIREEQEIELGKVVDFGLKLLKKVSSGDFEVNDQGCIELNIWGKYINSLDAEKNRMLERFLAEHGYRIEKWDTFICFTFITLRKIR